MTFLCENYLLLCKLISTPFNRVPFSGQWVFKLFSMFAIKKNDKLCVVPYVSNPSTSGG
jgi:hypothetical protein